MTTTTRVIVVGAGWSGLVAAKTYLEICRLLDRSVDLTILDDGTDPGGVWSTARLYPGLIANSPVGLYEYSHMSMVDEKHPWYQLLSGDVVQNYLEAYARKFDIYSKIRFQTRVTSARRRGSAANSGWIIETSQGELWECDKLLIACGLYNKPRIPTVPSSTYTGVSIHHKELGRRNAALRVDSLIKNIVVVGGCKSAVEACNVFLPALNPNKQHRVSWVIRPSETGVPMVVQDVDKSGNIIAINQSRCFSTISPSVYDTSGFGYKFFHSGKYFIGTLLISYIWRLMSWALKRDAGYDSSANGRSIKPQGTSLFFDLNNVSLLPKESPVLKYLHADDDSIFKVHRATPIKLQDREMVLISADGQTHTVPCDAVIWCTGWLPAIDFFSDKETRELGLPVLIEDRPPVPDPKDTPTRPEISNPKPASTYFSQLSPTAQAAEEHILSLFPALRSPARPGYSPDYTAYRLYRQCLPLSSFPSTDSKSCDHDRSLAFSGLVSNSQTAICSELTALWSVAYLEDLLPPTSLPSTRAEAEENVELALAFQRRRYGVKGARDPEIVLEVQSFLDLICRDLKVEVHRKRNAVNGKGWWEGMKGWVREYCTPYFARDYATVLEEFLEIHGHLKRSDALK